MANEVNIKIKADDMASDKIESIGGKAKSLRGSFTKLATAGAGVTTMLGFFAKAAIEQQQGIEILDNALQTIEIRYEDVEEQLEATFASTQKLTNYGDDVQRDVFQRLIRATGDYELSLQALPAILDIAAARGQDVASITDAVARGFNGQIGGLTRYGVTVDENSDKLGILATIMDTYGGAAEAAKDPTTDLTNLIGDLQEAIGDQLLPVLEPTAQSLSDAVTSVIDWTTENPKLTQALVLGTAALGAFALVLGVIGLALPAVIAGAAALATPLIIVGGLAGMFMTLKNALDLSRDAGESVGISFEGLDEKINDFSDTLKNKVMSVLGDATKGVDDNTEAIDENITKVKELTQAEIDAVHHKERIVRDNIDLHKSELEEIESMEKQHRKVIGAQIRAEQKAKQAAQSGDFSMTFADFLAVENARVMGMPDVISTGVDVGDPLARAFRRFAAGSQMSEHGERGRIAQERLKKLLDRSNMIANPSLGGGVPEVNMTINGDIYGMEDFNIKTEQAVVSGINAGAIPYNEETF